MDNQNLLPSPRHRFAALAVVILMLASGFLASCQTGPSTSGGQAIDIEDQLGSDSPLIKAGPVSTWPLDRSRTLLFLASLPLLSGQIDTALLAKEGYGQWRESALARLRPVQAIKINFATQIIDGQPDTQSGMLFLPVYPAGASPSLSWIIHTKGTELKRDQVPSNNLGAETPIAACYASLGYAVWMPDYAGMGDSPGVHPYCVPESLGNSARDGLAAARDYLNLVYGTGSDSRPHYRESGRVYVVGYSEGGLAAMASTKAILERPLPGLAIETSYAMSAPLNLTTNAEKLATEGGFLGHPEYQIWLAMGWARAYPDAIKLEEILTDRILEKAVPLFDGSRDSSELLAAVAKIVGQPADKVGLGDIFRQSYIDLIKTDPQSASLFAHESRARLDRWLPPPDLPIVLAASPFDQVVSPSNSQSALEWINQQSPSNRLEYIRLGSKTHATAAGEALLYAILKLDNHEQDALKAAKLAADSQEALP